MYCNRANFQMLKLNLKFIFCHRLVHRALVQYTIRYSTIDIYRCESYELGELEFCLPTNQMKNWNHSWNQYACVCLPVCVCVCVCVRVCVRVIITLTILEGIINNYK